MKRDEGAPGQQSTGRLQLWGQRVVVSELVPLFTAGGVFGSGVLRVIAPPSR